MSWLFHKAKRRTALVLGGGSSRGVAHIGVLKVLEQAGVRFDMVVGTSIGSLIGAVYCLGLPLEKLEERAMHISWADLLDLCIPKTGLAEGRKLQRLIEELIAGKGFDDLKTPLYVVATDIEKGQEVIYSSGHLARIVRASCSIPGIFTPVEIEGRLLVDGGIKNTVPSYVARNLGADFIVASDVGFCVKQGKLTNIIQVIIQAQQIKGQELNNYQSSLADIVIRPELGDIDQLDYSRPKEVIKCGQDAAEKALAEIKQALKMK